MMYTDVRLGEGFVLQLLGWRNFLRKLSMSMFFLLSAVLMNIRTVNVFAQKGTGNGIPVKEKSIRAKGIKTDQGVYLIADGREDSIVLRWAPTSPSLWSIGNRYGYIIEKFTIMRNGVFIADANKHPEILTKTPLLPLGEKEMELLEKDDKYVGLVHALVYNRTPQDKHIDLKDPTTILQQYQQLTMQVGFGLLACDFSVSAARAAGLFFVDKNVQKKDKYIYRVSIAQPTNKNKSYQPGVVVVQPQDAFLRPRIYGLCAQFGDRTVSIGWNIRDVAKLYTAFNIEKSTDGKTFIKVNKDPYVNVVSPEARQNTDYAYFTDSLSKNNVTYYYRIKGLTPFADEGPVSDTIKGEGIANVTSLPHFDTIFFSSKDSAVFLKWHLSDSIKMVTKSVCIDRSSTPKGPFMMVHKQLLSIKDSLVKDLQATSSNYYRIRILKKNGTQTATYPSLYLIDDTIPPAIPTGFKAIVDSKGIVTISWRSNKEKDLKGYIIRKCDKPNGVYADVVSGAIKDTLVHDTLNLERFNTPKMYYQVYAIDKVYNVGDATPPISVSRPDTIAPIAPTLLNMYQKDTVIHLSFLRSVSEDVATYKLYRHKVGGINRDTIGVSVLQTYNNPLNDTIEYVDTPSVMGTRLWYEMITTDSSNNKTLSQTSGALLFEIGYRKPVANVSGYTDTVQKAIVLTWEYKQPDIDKFIIYRAVNNETKFLTHATLPGNTFRYVDKELYITNTYKYKIKAMLKTGIQSAPTKEVIITYP